MSHYPQLVCTVYSERFGPLGYLAIHNRVHDRACGGVRLAKDPSQEEIRLAAKAMAYKAGFIGFPMGGAKAAVCLDHERPDQRDARLFEFGKAIAPMVRTASYLPGVDMNSTLNDIEVIFRGAGVNRNVSHWKSLTHLYTAWSCYESTLAALELRGIDPSASTFAVQGFGRVASEYMKLMAKAGAKLLAVSNRKHAIVNPKGLDIPGLLKLRDERGEACLDGTPVDSEAIAHETLLALPVHVLLPAAVALVIHEQNVDRVQAEVVICAANVPLSDIMEQRLFKRGKTVVTDFVANCGGLFGSRLDHEVGKDSIRRILQDAYRQKVSHMLKQSKRTGTPFFAMARRESESRMDAWNDSPRQWRERIKTQLWHGTPSWCRVRKWQRFYEVLWCPD